MANYPSSDPTNDSLHTAVNNLSTALDGAIDDVVVTLTVLDTTGFPTVGAVTIEAERISYTGKTGTTFTGCTRGFGGTNNVPHGNTTPVKQTYGAEYHEDIKDEVIAIATDLIDGIEADLDDGVAPATTAASNKIRLDHLATAHKNATGEADWKTTPAKTTADNATDIGNNATDIGNNTTAIGLKADDSAALHNTGDEAASGVKDFTGQLKGKGTTTNDDAAAGYIGESVISVQSARINTPATNVWGDLTSVSLTAGDWLLSINGDINCIAVITDFAVGISTTPGNSAAGLVYGDNYLSPNRSYAINDRDIYAITSHRVSLASPATVYLKYKSIYASTIPQMSGRVTAVRIR